MSLNRRAFVTGLGVIAGGAPIQRALAQSSYPTGVGNIRVIVPFAPGGASDVIGRLLVDSLTRRWGTPVVLENVPGAGSTTGIGRVAGGPRDGSQILILSIPYITTQFLMPKLAYDPEKDIVPLIQLTRQPSLLCVRKDLPVASVAELVSYAKANPDKLSYASSGVGSPGHLGAELLKKAAGIQMKHVPYKGSAPAQMDLVAGHVDLFIDNAAAIIGLVRAKSVKALAITAGQRSAMLPDFAPVADTLPGYSVTGWFGAGVAGGTPEPIQAAIRAACQDLLAEKATIDRLTSLVSEPAGGKPQDFAAFLKDERSRWGDLIRDMGLRT